jgi:hypothetical protein
VSILTAEVKRDKTFLAFLRSFLGNEGGIGLCFALGAVVVFLKAEVQGMFVFVGLFSVVIALCADLLASLPAFLFAAMFLIKCTDSYSTFIPYWWMVFFPAAGILFHFIAYRPNPKKNNLPPFRLTRGEMFAPILAASIAITAGGLGTITAKEYFGGASLYHMVMLGFGMLAAYILFMNYIPASAGQKLRRYLPHLMAALGLFACLMVFHHYLTHFSTVLKTGTVLQFQWRNNVSTFLMLSIPFPFYLALKKPGWTVAGLAMFFALLLSGSRGALIFGTIEFLMCVAVLFTIDRRRRVPYLIVGGLMVVAAAVFAQDLFGFLGSTVNRLITITDQEVRMRLYERALTDFFHHPIFGTGIGYMGNRDVHPSKAFSLCWYHCEPLQILGSLGLVGVGAFVWQLIARCITFLKKRSAFHITLFISYVGVEMMSLVNPGVFAPLPYLLLVTLFLAAAEKSRVAEAEETAAAAAVSTDSADPEPLQIQTPTR